MAIHSQDPHYSTTAARGASSLLSQLDRFVVLWNSPPPVMPRSLVFQTSYFLVLL
jgi:hypothetical protein